MSQSTAMSLVAQASGTSEEEITEVLRGMIVSSKAQHGAKATNAEMAVVAGTCAKYGLNPLTKEVHAFSSGGKLQLIVGVDGWSKIALRQPDYDGVEFEETNSSDGKLVAMTCKIYSKSRSRPTSVTERMDECFDHKSSVWKKYSHRMLRHKAYIQCCRMAFGISEIIDDDERNRITGNTEQPKQVQQPKQEVDFIAMEQSMLECGDIESLNQLCVEIRAELEKGNAWNDNKATCATMKNKHKKRIEDMHIEEVIAEDEFFEGELEVVEAEEDVPFE